MHLCARRDDVAQQRLGPLHIDGEIVVDEEHRHLSLLATGALLQGKQFVLTPIRTPSPRLHGNNAKRPPTLANFLQQPMRGLGHKVELIEIHRLPGNRGIVGKRRLALLAECIHWSVDLFQFSACRVVHDQRPGGVRFTESDGIRVSRTAIAAQGLVGQLRHMRTAHHHRYANRPNGVCDAVSLRDHSGHGADPYQLNTLLSHPLRDFRLIHGNRVTVDEHHFVTGRSQCLQQKHPQVRHEIARDSVVGVIEEDFHDGHVS